MSGVPAITDVSGGVGGIEAQWAAGTQLATHYDEAGDRSRSWARLARVAGAGDLVESAPLSPVTFATAEAAVLRATVGPDGALGRCVAWEAEAVAVRAALAHLIVADELAHDAVEARDYALGRAVGSAGLVLGAAAVASPLTVATVVLSARLGALDGLGTVVERAAIEHPGVVQALFNGGGGLVDGLTLAPGPLHPDTGSAAAAAAAAYDDGRPRVVELRPTTLAGMAGLARVPLPTQAGVRPRDLAGLIGGLAGVAGLSQGADSPLNGTIAVSTLTDADGTVRHIVYVPGTDDMATTPWSQDDDVRDMGTNLDLMAGRDTAYGDGVLQAMHRAGVGPDEPVLLVGHSQGGMEAAALAAQDTPFHVTHLVTAGAPTAQVDLPSGTHTLSLENRGDVIPLTDGEHNRPGIAHATVTFDAGGDGLVGHHAYASYVAGAIATDASTDPSVTTELDSLRADGFLGDGGSLGVQTRVFQVTRR